MVIKTCADPQVTFDDDPLRMLRGIRFATRLNFRIEVQTFDAIKANVSRIEIVSQERISDEINGMMSIELIEAGIRGDDIHYPDTSLICLENAHGSGVVLPLEYMKSVRTLADQYGLKVHLDGARLFNAATYLKVDVNIDSFYYNLLSQIDCR